MNLHVPYPNDLDPLVSAELARRSRITNRAARGAALRLREMGIKPPVRIAPSDLVLDRVDADLPAPLPAAPRVPKKFTSNTNNVRLIVKTVLVKHRVSRSRLLAPGKADRAALHARQEICYRLLRYGKVRGVRVTPGVVGRLIERDRTTVLYNAEKFAADRGWDL